MKLVGIGLKKIVDLQSDHTLVSVNAFWIHSRINQKTSLMNCFDARMYTIMAEETNKYARRRKQNRKYKNFFYFLSKNFLFFHKP